MSDARPTEDPEENRDERLARVIFDCTSRVSSGEALDPRAVLRSNPDLLPELELALEVLQEASPPDSGRPRLESLGGHRILREIGRGGMGVVYEALELALGRQVALKVLPLPPLVDERRRDRFLREARAAARLHHTRIVPVFEVGEEAGVLFYTMQYIRGRALDRVLRSLARRRDLATGEAAAVQGGEEAEEDLANLLQGAGTPHSTRRAYHLSVARIGAEVADALHHAHLEGVLHRDVKPSNIILDFHGSAWLTDFGLAKNEIEPDALTLSGDVVGTVAYMAPERFAGKADARSDLYSLGATLYELLALRPAFQDPDRRQLIRKVAEHEPRPLRQIDPGIPRDLETIVLKAMAREPERRFSSGAELKAELDHFLCGEPIRSRLAGPVERTVRWCRRYPLTSSLGGAVVLLLATLLAVVYVSARRLSQRLYVSEVSMARALRASSGPGRRFESLAAIERAVSTAPPDADLSVLRDEAIAALALADIRVASRHPETLIGRCTPVFDADLERYAILDVEHDQVLVRRVKDGADVCSLQRGAGTTAVYSFSPDGRFLGTRSIAGDRRRLHVLRLADGSVAIERETAQVDTDLRFCAGGRVLMGEADGSISTVLLDSGAVEKTLRPRAAAGSFRLSPDSRRILVQLPGVSALDVIDLDDSARRLTIVLTASYFGAEWSPDGRLIAVPREGRIDLWDARTGDLFQSLEGHLGAVIGVTFSPAGLLASVSWDATLRLWDPWCGDSLLTVGAPLLGFSFNRDGSKLAAAMSEVTVFEVECGSARRALRCPAAPGGVGGMAVATHSGGRLLATTWSLWDLEDGRELLSPLDGWQPSQLRFLPGGSRVWLEQGTLMAERSLDLREKPEEAVFAFGPAQPLSEVPSGLAACDFDGSGRVAVWVEANSRVVLHRCVERRNELLGQHSGADQISVTRDGQWAVSGTYNRGKGLKVWDLNRLAPVQELEAARWIHGFFSPSGRWLATATGDSYSIHEVGTWSRQFSFSRDTDKGVPGPCAWSPDGTFLAMTLAQGSVSIFDTAAGTVAARLLSPQPRGILVLEITPDGERLIAGCANAAAEVWDLRAIAAGLEGIGLGLGRGLTPRGARRTGKPLSVELLEDQTPGFDSVGSGEAGRETPTGGVEDPDRLALAASSLAARGQWGEAIRLWEKAVNVSPESAPARNSLAWALVIAPEDLRDPPRALALAEAAVREGGENPAFLNTLGAAHYRMGNYRQSIDVLLRQTSGGSGVTAWDSLFIAMSLKELGLDSLARYHYEGALRWIERQVQLSQGQARQLSALQREAASLLEKSAASGQGNPPARQASGPKD